MLVDDDADIRLALRRYLERDGSAFRVVAEASDGEEALALAAAAQPDVVILDLTMPGSGGLDVLPSLRETLSESRIVVFSGVAHELTPGRAHELGADEVVGKTDGLSALGAALGGHGGTTQR